MPNLFHVETGKKLIALSDGKVDLEVHEEKTRQGHAGVEQDVQEAHEDVVGHRELEVGGQDYDLLPDPLGAVLQESGGVDTRGHKQDDEDAEVA